MNEFKPSKYQQAVYDFIENGSGHAIIEAVAGSGKTTTIVNSLKLISPDKDIIFCAFNNSIVAELKKRTPFYVDVTTMHSLGWRAMLAYYDGCKLNPNKVFKIAERVLWRVPKRERGYYFMILQKLIDLYRQNLIEDEEAFVELAEKHNLDVYNGEIEDAIKIFMMMLEDNKEFDFTDMIYIPAILDEVKLKKYDFVFVDECQDLNIAQQRIIRKIMKPTARLISVGDSRQSIYGFAGADIESFKKLANFPNTTSLPLSISYRCSKAVVRKAQEIVPQIEYYDKAPEGEARDGEIKEIEEGDWVLCRNVKPLVILCVNLLREGKKACIRGNDIAKGIINLLKRTKEQDYERAFEKLKQKLNSLRMKLQARGIENPDRHPSVVSLKEKISVIDYLNDENLNRVDKIIEKLESIFGDGKDGVMLSTIHKAKGLENDRVFLVCPELLPSKYAVQEWQKVQERNLEYVAYTRAKKELIIVRDFDVMDDFIVLDL